MLERFGLAMCVALLAAGCGGNNPYLAHYHRTVSGVDLSANVTDSTPSGHITLGYSRRLTIISPRELVTGKDNEVLSSVFCTEILANFAGASIFREVLATGDAAVSYASSTPPAVRIAGTELPNQVCPDIKGVQ